jgi:hypothetical protein
MNAVQGFIVDQRNPQKEIMNVLRTWVLDMGPHVQEKLSYKIPFFYFYGPLCYLNPKPDGVDLGLVQGKSLSKEQDLLQMKERKTVATIRFHNLAEAAAHEEQVRQILNEAAILNQYLHRNKTKK